MKEERVLNERIRLLEKEIQTLVSEMQKIESLIAGMDDLDLELKGIKVFLGRIHPEFKKELPLIVKKLKES